MKIDWWVGAKRFSVFMTGLFLISLGVAFMVNGALGVAPWDVFHLGVEKYIPLTLGQVMQVAGLTLIVISCFMGVKPNLGTILNMIFIGVFFDLIVLLGFTYSPEGIVMRILFFCIGTFIYGFGTGMYISADWGPGPRDSLMVALNQKTGVRIAYVRGGIEITVLAIGFLLGGPIGIGTVGFSLFIGFIVEFGLYCMKRFLNHTAPVRRGSFKYLMLFRNLGYPIYSIIQINSILGKFYY